MDSTYDQLIQDTATFYGLPKSVLRAQVFHESSGDSFAFRFEPAFFQHYLRNNPMAKSAPYGPLGACSYGLLQPLLETALEHGFTGRPEDLFDASTNLHIGAGIMRELWTKAGGQPENYRTALVHYNGTGPAAEAYADAVLKLSAGSAGQFSV